MGEDGIDLGGRRIDLYQRTRRQPLYIPLRHSNEAATMFEMMRDMVATGHMGWVKGVNMVLLAVLLILGVVALFNYIVFR